MLFRFLQPAIVEIWNQEQQSMLSTLQASDRAAFLGMDMRADSMGHSAKYGSYSVVELHLGKVLHVELVQVNVACIYGCSLVLGSYRIWFGFIRLLLIICL